jgi:polyferredoxin
LNRAGPLSGFWASSKAFDGPLSSSIPFPSLNQSCKSKRAMSKSHPTNIVDQDLEVLVADSESFRDRVSTIDEKGKRIWLYPKKPGGRFFTARIWTSLAFFAIFLILPWIKVNGEPLFLFDVLHRRFILFGLVFTPQDFHLFVLAMLTFFVFIILFTVVFGRLFCGWVCPQTNFMEMLFRRIEYWIEGDYKQQQKLDASPWTTEKLRKKAFKFGLFFALAVLISNYFLAYLIGMDQVLLLVTEPVHKNLGSFVAMLIFSLAFFTVYVRLREQVCTTICPYGRMQGVLLVEESIVVIYDWLRGEPRGKMHKANSAAKTKKDPCECNDCEGQGACKADKALKLLQNPIVEIHAAVTQSVPSVKAIGDCIDCNLCVAVCPTGIDIRNGTQLECINCTACIDACDQVMDKIGRPRGLIRYDSVKGVKDQSRHLFTPRVYAYSAVLLLLLVVDMALFVSRGQMESIILRSPGQVYQKPDSLHISNLYTYRLINKSTEEIPVEIRVKSPRGAKIRLVGPQKLELTTEKHLQGVFFIDIPRKQLRPRTTKIQLEIWSKNQKIDHLKTNFLGPLNP